MTQALKDFNPKIVTIGNRVWMQENLAIDDGGDGIYYNKANNQYYYTWDAAMRVAKSIPGWHLPSAEEWNAAAEACGAAVVDNRWKVDPYLRYYEGTEKLYDSLRVLSVGYYYYGCFFNVGSCASIATFIQVGVKSWATANTNRLSYFSKSSCLFRIHCLYL